MPTFVYKGRNRLNELVSGEREAASQDELRNLLRREQESLSRAELSPSRSARAVHRAFALEYGKLLVKSTYPHNRFQTDAERASLREQRRHRELALGRWEGEGGSLKPA